MKKIQLLLICLFTITFSSCEKDDICDATTDTTPRLIVEFFDILNPTVKKNVTNLAVKEINTSTSLVFTGTSKIQIPLKTNQDLTKYSFILNSTDVAIKNKDFLLFNYSRQTVFVSRACGFKTNFTLDSTTPFIKTETSIPDGYWIQNVVIATSNITTEKETHVKIYF
jgi:hypothetical protein